MTRIEKSRYNNLMIIKFHKDVTYLLVFNGISVIML